jgi:hypothetical protein
VGGGAGAAAPLTTFGSAQTFEWERPMVRRGPARIRAGAGRLDMEVGAAKCRVAIHDPRARLHLAFAAEAGAAPQLIAEDAPFGSGFIGWGLVPGMRVTGRLDVCDRAFALGRDWFCYHDHNFGRFQWGENVGWEWLVAHATSNGRPVTVVFDCRTDRTHGARGLPFAFVYLDSVLRKVFLGPALRVRWEWEAQPVRPVRLPGAMAALFDGRTSRLPRALHAAAADDRDRFRMSVAVGSVTQLVVPDNQCRQYTIIEELTGAAALDLCLRGEECSAEGLAYGEYTH